MKKTGPMAVAILVLAAVALAPASSPGAQASRSSQPKSTGSAKPALTPDTLDQLLAPIALYPDQLLAQVLLCATDPAQVAKLDGWLKTKPPFKGTALQEAAKQTGFEPSFVALSLFPQVVDFMAKDSSWTTRLGQAFASDRAGVLASVQRLRASSQAAGTLKSTPQQTVNTVTTEAGQQVIVIEPANPQVVYVPQYNPQIVYTQPSSTTVVVKEEDDDTEAAVAGVVGFAAGIAIGAAIDNDYYYGPYGWGGAPYMYNDAWDDWYDDREDAREDWYENREDAREDYQDRREDVAGERTERTDTRQQQRTERTDTRQETRPETQAQREQRRTDAQAATPRSQGTGTSTYQSKGRSGERPQTATQRTSTGSDAFSGYSSGKSERAASSRGQRSRSSGGGGRSRRR
jgi:hypothetical protein